jgi:hypothetical protein
MNLIIRPATPLVVEGARPADTATVVMAIAMARSVSRKQEAEIKLFTHDVTRNTDL